MGWSLIDFTADLTGRGSEPSSTPARHRCEKSQQEPESEVAAPLAGPPHPAFAAVGSSTRAPRRRRRGGWTARCDRRR